MGGTALFHPAGFQHEDEIGPGGGRFFLVEYPDAWLDGLPDRTRSASRTPGQRSCLALAIDLLREHRLAATPLAIEAAALELLAACLSAPEPETGFTDQAHFTRVFRKVTGQPPGAVRRLLLSG